MYILTSERYKEYIKSVKFKYLPDFFIPSYKPKIIDSIIKDEILLGDVAGIVTRPIDYTNESQLEKYIKNINNIKTKNHTKIYIEDYNKIPIKTMDKIINETELNLIYGDTTRILNIPNIIKEIHKYLKQDYYSKDTLIICSDICKLKSTLDALSDDIRFFTVVGVDSSKKEEIYEEILDSTGISIFQPSNLEKVIKNYGIIINFNDIIEFDVNSIRNESLILDFSRLKPFAVINKAKKSILIDEIKVDMKLDSYKWIERRVTPDLSEALGQKEDIKFRQIGTKNNFYYIKDYIYDEIKIKGKV